MLTPVAHDAPVVGLNPEEEVQPAGYVAVLTLSHDAPVVGPNPEADVQPAGKLAEFPAFATQTALDFGTEDSIGN